MPKFRKKPVVIEAVTVAYAMDAARIDWQKLPGWMRASYDAGGVVFEDDQISINTLEGTMVASRGDWIIQGAQGELYPCKPDIFAETYEEA